MIHETITSRENQRLKAVGRVRDGKNREYVFVEGLRLCEEALTEIFPERDNLELSINPRDAALLEKLNPAWLARYPGLRIRAEASLQPGDCQVRSRFGLTDARLATKLTALEHSLAPA